MYYLEEKDTGQRKPVQKPEVGATWHVWGTAG